MLFLTYLILKRLIHRVRRLGPDWLEVENALLRYELGIR